MKQKQRLHVSEEKKMSADTFPVARSFQRAYYLTITLNIEDQQLSWA